MTMLATWASQHAVAEAYRVTKIACSHGGPGWQVTLWRSGDAWCAHRAALPFGAPSPPVEGGHRISLRRAHPLLEAVERAALWTAPPWPYGPAPDSNEIRVEAWRGGRAVVRASYNPDPILREHAWEIFEAFRALHPPRWMIWRRISL